MTTTYVYLMKLEGDNYYVGETSNHEKLSRLDVQSKWMKVHPPVELIDCWEMNNKEGISNKTVLTLFYMSVYGIDKVRGGGYSEPKLLEAALRNINNYHKHMKDAKTLDELIAAYVKVNEVNNKIWRTTNRMGLQYYDVVNRFDDLGNNKEFMTLDETQHLTRSKKRRIFGDNIEFKTSNDKINKRRKVK